MRNVVVVISGPSGVGKGTIAKRLCEDNENMFLSISATTRAPRMSEENGREYYFITKEEFEDRIGKNGFLEYSNHFGSYYGTPRDKVLEKLNKNDIVLEIDVNGGLNVKKNYKDAVLIMIVPPTIEEVKKRLIERNTESLDKIEERLSRISYELEKQKYYDYAVVNDNLDMAVKQVEDIINKEKNR